MKPMSLRNYFNSYELKKGHIPVNFPFRHPTYVPCARGTLGSVLRMAIRGQSLYVKERLEFKYVLPFF